MKKIIIDTDPGIDDTMAIYFALNSNVLDVIGITTVYGNTSNTQGTENALRILEIAKRDDIPVHTGASKPLTTEYLGKGEVVHGKDGQGNSNLVVPQTKESNLTAVEYLKNQINQFPGEITLVPIGPLTNIAQLLIEYPDIDQKIAEIVLMGGNALSQGNASPAAEANIRNDPEAANTVFSSNTLITMVGLDVTNEVFMDDNTIQEITDSGSKETDHLKIILPHYVEFLSKFYNKKGMPIHDSSAIAYLVDKNLFKTISFPIVVETEGISRGKTWMGTSKTEDINDPWANRVNVNICIEVDSEKTIELIKTTLTNL
jgi:inosine-uridine nucleoside N-ribohydrolase|tara:strand:- start:867 stop:1814 length:948 start_codon:yes stop_codon:yes gene_type:complete